MSVHGWSSGASGTLDEFKQHGIFRYIETADQDYPTKIQTEETAKSSKVIGTLSSWSFTRVCIPDRVKVNKAVMRKMKSNMLFT